MKKMVSILISIVLLCVSPFSTGDDLGELYREGVNAFKKGQFSNAEYNFSKLYTLLRAQNLTHKPVYYYVIQYLALSRSEQGETQGVSSLFKERLEIGKRQFGTKSYDTGNNLMSLAEASYREGDVEKALALLAEAEGIYNNLDPRFHDRLSFLKKNRKEYKSGPFDRKKLPYDLSEFYQSCSEIPLSKKYIYTKLIMQNFVEVGVDYKPDGTWFEIFSNSKLLGVSSPPDHDKRIVFIPKVEDSLKDEWCVVYVKDGNTVAAFAHEG